jgi:hypothetical protein
MMGKLISLWFSPEIVLPDFRASSRPPPTHGLSSSPKPFPARVALRTLLRDALSPELAEARGMIKPNH